MGYEMRGLYLEVCDCHVPCPCWFDQDPDDAECTGVVAWHIEQGVIDRVDVSGLTVASVSHHGGHRGAAVEAGKMRIALLIDERATDQQANALENAFTGTLGGPLGELAAMTGQQAVDRASIGFTTDGRRTKLTVAKRVGASMAPLVGSTGRVTTIGDGALGTLLGSPAEAGRADRYRLNMPGTAFDLDLRGRSATRGRFAYTRR